MQWQTYGYIPSALPESNCFGEQQVQQQGGAKASGAVHGFAVSSAQATEAASLDGSARVS